MTTIEHAETHLAFCKEHMDSSQTTAEHWQLEHFKAVEALKALKEIYATVEVPE